MITYYKLFDMLNRMGMKKSDLRAMSKLIQPMDSLQPALPLPSLLLIS